MEQAASNFLLSTNGKFLSFYTDEGMDAASYKLIEILDCIFPKYDPKTDDKDKKIWKTTWNSSIAIENFPSREGVDGKLVDPPQMNNYISIPKLIKILTERKIVINPFTFWSFIFTNKHDDRHEIIGKVLKKLELLELKGYEGKISNCCGTYTPTIDGWMQNVATISKYAQECWSFFKALMDLKGDEKDFTGINEKINFIINNKLVENSNIVINGINKANIQNVLEFIRPDLHFTFKGAQIMNITKSSEIIMENTIKLLESSKQIILTGAPGTGKTYLAKEIAKRITGNKENIAFCQFHPSFDYTDFVEGLRPVDNENESIGFKLTDGIFKDFCKKALKNYLDSQKTGEQIAAERLAQNKIDAFLNDAIENELQLETTGIGKKFYIREFNENKITVNIPENDKTTELELPYRELKKIIAENRKLEKACDIKNVFNRSSNRHSDFYIFAIFQEILKQQNNQTAVPEKEKVSQQNFVFIIDEINRGDISKIFGELFFAIDPGYRGEKGRVKTQYHNLIKNTDDLYKDGFYVPENVYIIGTMNDIDRSVESMDFAIRRRFTWKEIKAEDRISMFDDKIKDWAEEEKVSKEAENKMKEALNEAKNRMKALNAAISATDSLSDAFHIGPAYFLKLIEYEGDFSKLWELHIMPLLKEYLRGTVDPENDLKRFKAAYDLKKQTDNESASTASEE